MINQIKKFSFLINLSDPNDAYEILVNNKSIPVTNNHENYYTFEFDIRQKNTVKIKYIKKTFDSYLHIKQLAFNNIELYNLDMFSTYFCNNRTKKTHGWMDELGAYTINLHGDPVTQNLLTYLLSTKE